MSDTPNEAPKDDLIPRFRFSEKKVDSSWKDEIRKEKELQQKNEPPKPAKSAKPHGHTVEEHEDLAPYGQERAAGAESPSAAQGEGKQKVNKIFLSFIAQMVQQVLMQLGKVEHPMTGQAEIDIEGARYTLELLTAIEEKTRGNLADQEKRGLTEALRELKFHYVETVNALKQQMQAQMQPPPGRGR